MKTNDAILDTADRAIFRDINRWVFKIGSSMITNNGAGIDTAAMEMWAKQISDIHKRGGCVLLVSSGAIAAGMKELSWKTRPTELADLQAAAAVGQMQLAKAWQEAFAKEGLAVAQVLITHDDCADRRRYLNIRSSLNAMCDHKIVPVINENDTVAFDEIKFGDNDNLGAMVANIVQAGAYLILTDQQGMFDKNPRDFPDAKLLEKVSALDTNLLKMAGKTGGVLGSGGMLTKVLAAQKAARSGTHTLLAYGREPEVISKLSRGENIGTWFVAPNDAQTARKQWLGAQLQVQGTLIIDDGARIALQEMNKSLLPVGVLRVEGDFLRGSLISCVTKDGEEIARGLCAYDAADCRIFAKKHSHEITDLLIHGENLIHRDNLVLM